MSDHFQLSRHQLRLAWIAACSLILMEGCVGVRAGPVIASNGDSVTAGGTVGVRVYHRGFGHYYDSNRPVVGLTANAAFGSKGLARMTAGPELGLDNFWTDEEHGDWSYRGIFVRAEGGRSEDDQNGRSGTFNYFGGGATVLFRIGGSDLFNWGLDASAGRAAAADGSGHLSWAGSIFVEWP